MQGGRPTQQGMRAIHLAAGHVREPAIVMEQGQIVMEGPPPVIFADLERLRQLKLAIPEPIELAARLRRVGFPLSPGALTVEAIARELVQ